MSQNATTATVTDWLAAVHDSSRTLRELVAGLTEPQLNAPSYAGDWSVAQVLSHLGSAAEIGTVLLQRGMAGDDSAPTPQDTGPVWERWNALAATEQRAQWIQADTTHRDTLRTVVEKPVRVPYFAGLLTVKDYAGYRLSEQSLHGWDVAVALESTAAIAPAEVSLLWQRLDLVATRFRAPDALARLSPRQIAVHTSSPNRTYCLTLGTELHLLPCEAADPSAVLRGSAEAVLRLVYGRHRDTDDVTVDGALTLADMQALFPGY